MSVLASKVEKYAVVSLFFLNQYLCQNQHAASVSDLAIEVVTAVPNLILNLGHRSWERNVQLAHFISGMKLTVVMSLLLYDAWCGYEGKSLFSGKVLCFTFLVWKALTIMQMLLGEKTVIFDRFWDC